MKFIFLSLICVFSIAWSADQVDEGAYVYDFDKSLLKSLSINTELVFDHVSKTGFEVYGPKGLMDFLQRQKIPHQRINEVSVLQMQDYPSPEEINEQIWDLHKKNPEITQVFSLGKSVKGREILGIKISDNAMSDELEPEFKYISSMHGDEITGRELMILLVDDLIKNYGIDERITRLVNETEIYIIPSMNPDGSAMIRRGNGNGVDLNRNFPDFSTHDDQNVPGQRQIETRHIMQFQKERNFALSANYHGGAAVMNYAWDTIGEKHPFHDLLVELSLIYANKVDYFKNSSEFSNGITNGYDWYELNGGMQDWSYYWHNDLQFTVEVSVPKWPSYSQIPYYYSQNKEAMIAFMESIHRGAGVAVVDEAGERLQMPAQIQVYKITNQQKVSMGVYSTERSEFYKVLPYGEYEFSVSLQNGNVFSARTIVDGSSANYLKWTF